MSGLQMKYFMLNPSKPSAYGAASRAAMLAFAAKIEPENADLAVDLRDWVRRTEPPVAPPVQLPKIGAPWPGQGGIYAGLVRGDEGEPDYHLIVAEPAVDNLTWKDAGAWARGLQVGTHTDYDLPMRKEQAVMYGNVPQLFEREWYWSCEQYAGGAASAWCQDFDYGNQSYYHEISQLRARAVRRLTL